jgi:hypothetical protein
MARSAVASVGDPNRVKIVATSTPAARLRDDPTFQEPPPPVGGRYMAASRCKDV